MKKLMMLLRDILICPKIVINRQKENEYSWSLLIAHFIFAIACVSVLHALVNPYLRGHLTLKMMLPMAVIGFTFVIVIILKIFMLFLLVKICKIKNVGFIKFIKSIVPFILFSYTIEYAAYIINTVWKISIAKYCLSILVSIWIGYILFQIVTTMFMSNPKTAKVVSYIYVAINLGYILWVAIGGNSFFVEMS